MMDATILEPRRARPLGPVDDQYVAARRRLTLATLWLAGLIGWGLFSYLADVPGQDRDVGGTAAAEQGFDGRGKWAGY